MTFGHFAVGGGLDCVATPHGRSQAIPQSLRERERARMAAALRRLRSYSSVVVDDACLFHEGKDGSLATSKIFVEVTSRPLALVAREDGGQQRKGRPTAPTAPAQAPPLYDIVQRVRLASLAACCPYRSPPGLERTPAIDDFAKCQFRGSASNHQTLSLSFSHSIQPFCAPGCRFPRRSRLLPAACCLLFGCRVVHSLLPRGTSRPARNHSLLLSARSNLSKSLRTAYQHSKATCRVTTSCNSFDGDLKPCRD
jgi:hypothetical protein